MPDAAGVRLVGGGMLRRTALAGEKARRGAPLHGATHLLQQLRHGC